MEIKWDKNAIKRINAKIESIAKKNTPNRQKAADIQRACAPLGVNWDKKELEKLLDQGQIPQIKV